MILTALSSSSTTYWYLTRSTGAVALILLTLVVVLGVIDVSRLSSGFWPRFVTDSLHRRLSLLAVAFLGVHILTAVLDTYAPIGFWDAVIPFHSSYRPLWLGFGAIAFDMLLALMISSIFRSRIGQRSWRAIHWLAYACWPIAVLHGLGTGSDVKQVWMLVIDGVCVVSVIGAVALRMSLTVTVTRAVRVIGIAVPVAFALGLLVWLPGGPLATGWAARAGTPAKLIAHRVTTQGATR
jgi:sulfoxide reductase heme-binding subunit YedZ